jgi:hypothetical protein
MDAKPTFGHSRKARPDVALCSSGARQKVGGRKRPGIRGRPTQRFDFKA